MQQPAKTIRRLRGDSSIEVVESLEKSSGGGRSWLMSGVEPVSGTEGPDNVIPGVGRLILAPIADVAVI